MEDIMRMGICGPHSSGKSTLLSHLKSEPEFKDIEFLPEITRTINARGFNINESGTLETQILVMNTHMDNLLYHKKFIVDRCLIDGVVYTQFLYEQKAIPKWFFIYAERLLDNYIKMYNRIFYIPAEFPLTRDGVRSSDEHFYNRIKELFEERIQSTRKKHPEVPLLDVTGEISERVITVIQSLYTVPLMYLDRSK